mmetsp:Transcript_28952/g.62993  ORF Transcript_28952/g.62993 Transcript_28952/m.62993 type:complete len:265 (+) Transcript_28952:1310-2104(+)
MLRLVEETPQGTHDMRRQLHGSSGSQNIQRSGRFRRLPEFRDLVLWRYSCHGHLQALIPLQVEEIQRHQPLGGLSLHDCGHKVTDTSKGEKVLSEGDEGKTRRCGDQLTKVRAGVHGEEILREIQGLKRRAIDQGLSQGSKGHIIDGRIAQQSLLQILVLHPLVHNSHQLHGDLAGPFSHVDFLGGVGTARGGSCGTHGKLLKLSFQAMCLANHLVFRTDLIVQLARQLDHLHLHLLQILHLRSDTLRLQFRHRSLTLDLGFKV